MLNSNRLWICHDHYTSTGLNVIQCLATLQVEWGEVGRGVVCQQPPRAKEQQTRTVLQERWPLANAAGGSSKEDSHNYHMQRCYIAIHSSQNRNQPHGMICAHVATPLGRDLCEGLDLR